MYFRLRKVEILDIAIASFIERLFSYRCALSINIHKTQILKVISVQFVFNIFSIILCGINDTFYQIVSFLFSLLFQVQIVEHNIMKIDIRH